MTKYRKATIKCKKCGVRITGRVDNYTGHLHADRSPDNDAPEEPGLCASCYGFDDSGEAIAEPRSAIYIEE